MARVLLAPPQFYELRMSWCKEPYIFEIGIVDIVIGSVKRTVFGGRRACTTLMSEKRYLHFLSLLVTKSILDMLSFICFLN